MKWALVTGVQTVALRISQLEGLTMVVCVISMCIVILECFLGGTRGMVGGNVDASLELALVKLHALAGRVGIAPPVFGKVIGRIGIQLVVPMHLRGDVGRVRPGRAEERSVGKECVSPCRSR